MMVQLYFLKTTFYEGTGDITSVNIQTNTSQESIKDIWEQMSKKANEFKDVMLDKIYDNISILNSIRPVKSTQYVVERVSMMNKDRLSGVLLSFEMDIVSGCLVQDYFNYTATIADFVTLNSDAFLSWLCDPAFNPLGSIYGYELKNLVVNSVAFSNIPMSTHNAPDVRPIPQQVDPRITIPNYINDGGSYLSYDHNWIAYLQQIKNILKFGPSPFGHISDAVTDVGYPVDLIKSKTIQVNEEGNGKVYGEGFQIEFPIGTRFSFSVDYWYQANGGAWSKQHTCDFTESIIRIDGASVAVANTRNIQEYVW